MRIMSRPRDLREGLFGQVFLFVFEVLPYLDEKKIKPAWAIRSMLYGSPENDYLVIPGLLELNYDLEAPTRRTKNVSLKRLRKHATVALGNDWSYVSGLWEKYFRIPKRIIERADSFPNLDAALGLHYRGTDKNQSSVETNFVSQEEFMDLTEDFLEAHPEIRTILIASDEISFSDRLRAKYPGIQIVSSGEVIHHKDLKVQNSFEKGDHAVLDCLLLSRCKYLLKCQSALSGFAKVINPELEAYRISANKLAPWNMEIPYFPDGYLPKYQSKNPRTQEILARLFTDDWTENETVAKKFGKLLQYGKRGKPEPVLKRVARWASCRFKLSSFNSGR